jgi:hypothetical protein
LDEYGSVDEQYISDLLHAEDKYEAAIIMQPEAARPRPILHTYSIGDESSFNELDMEDIYKLDPLVDDAQLDIN